MKAIVLAAGEGSRLRPLTDDKPKCMVEYKGKPIIDYVLQALAENEIRDVVVVKGYKAERLERSAVRYYVNEDYASTNMVHTLFCAEEEMNDDIIVSYADIVYRPEILSCLLQAPHDFSVVVDKDWRKLWEARMELGRGGYPLGRIIMKDILF